MSGETGWTVDTLREHYGQRIGDLDRLLSRRMDDADKAIQAALVAAEKAVTKAETASEKRFEGVNEFRKALADQTATFIPRSEYDAALEVLTQRAVAAAEQIAALELRLTSRLDRGEGITSGASVQRTERRLDMGQVIAVIAVIAAIAAVVLAAVRK